MSYGLGLYGLSLYGSTTGPLSMVSAVATTTNTVRVVLTVPPLAQSPTGVGDALNPDTWTVQRLDSGFFFTIVNVVQVDTTIFDIRVLQVFGPANVTHEVSAPLLRKPNGDYISPPSLVDFPGLLAVATATAQAIAAARRFVLTDVANPPAPSGSNVLGGSLVMTPGGDYDSVSGAALVKKLIIRRLSTPKGGFFHLPDYGIGLRVKEPLPLNSLIKLKAEIERQILLEPEVDVVSAPLTFSPATGILVVQIKARLRKTGESIEIPFELPSTAVAL